MWAQTMWPYCWPNRPTCREETVLTVDVGTNAEIVLGNKEWMYSASSPTGPAFEGAQISYGMRAAPGAIERVRIDPVTKVAKFKVIGEERWSDEWPMGATVPVEEQSKQLASGICGSGIIEVVAEMFLQGILLADGRFNPAFDSDLMREEVAARRAMSWPGASTPARARPLSSPRMTCVTSSWPRPPCMPGPSC